MLRVSKPGDLQKMRTEAAVGKRQQLMVEQIKLRRQQTAAKRAADAKRAEDAEKKAEAAKKAEAEAKKAVPEKPAAEKN